MQEGTSVRGSERRGSGNCTIQRTQFEPIHYIASTDISSLVTRYTFPRYDGRERSMVTGFDASPTYIPSKIPLQCLSAYS